jgi:hypothetical protein
MTSGFKILSPRAADFINFFLGRGGLLLPQIQEDHAV